ncbi:MAG: ABC transporter permease [Oscillospiraceae bacterium]|nr:ABC transporter permease [Oscillospiraceae bacterium]
MKIFCQFTRRSLAKNRVRTLVTIIGIVLSMALLTAVIEGAYSGLEYMKSAEIASSGSYHVVYDPVTRQQADELSADPDVKQSSMLDLVGWADIGSGNPWKPYLVVLSADPGLGDLLSIRLTSGRMPEGPDEILLPDHLASNGGVRAPVGSTLTLDVGRRTSGGASLDMSVPVDEDRPEALTECSAMTFTVTGTYARLTADVEGYSCAGFTAFTTGRSSGSGLFLIRLERARQTDAFLERNRTVSSNFTPHADLLRLEGAIGNGNIRTTLYGFASILVFLIVFGSISLIYNSFSISVSERTRQFGLLKSVGATKKQILSCVLYEALLLGSIGVLIGLVVGCVGIGVTLYLLRGVFARLTVAEGVSIRLVLNAGALVTAAAVCLITTLIAAWIPARRALKVSPIDSIRQTQDVTVKAKAVRTSALTKKLFGFEGMMASRNFRRSRKRARSTVLSLFLSVLLFISASALCSYLTDAVTGFSFDDTEIDISYTAAGPDSAQADRIMAALSAAPGITRTARAEGTSYAFYIDDQYLSEEYRAYKSDSGQTTGASPSGYGALLFLDDDSFRDLCSIAGLTAEDYMDPSAPLGILYNHETTVVVNEKGSRYEGHSLTDSPAPFPVAIRDSKEYDGLIFYTVQTDEHGRDYAVYYTEEYLISLAPEDVPEIENAVLKPLEETYEETVFTIGAVTDVRFWIQNDSFVIYYADCVKDAFLPFDSSNDIGEPVTLLFQTEDHTAANAFMENALREGGWDQSRLADHAENKELPRLVVTVVNVFSYGFIILISLIAIANVFNTISTNVSLRRREFAMMRSVGLSDRGMRRMLNYECLIYGFRALITGLPAAALLCWVIWRAAGVSSDAAFYIPWRSVLIAVGSVFLVVFVTMLYAGGRIRKDDPIEALKNENV